MKIFKNLTHNFSLCSQPISPQVAKDAAMVIDARASPQQRIVKLEQKERALKQSNNLRCVKASFVDRELVSILVSFFSFRQSRFIHSHNFHLPRWKRCTILWKGRGLATRTRASLLSSSSRLFETYLQRLTTGQAIPSQLYSTMPMLATGLMRASLVLSTCVLRRERGCKCS